MINIRSHYGIRQQVLLITLIPMLVMTLVLAGYFISTRIADNQSALIERGETMSRLLSQASEFGLISGLTHQLSVLSQGPIQEADVADVIFINPKGKVLYRSNDFKLKLKLEQQPNHLIDDKVWLFTTPVTTQGIVVSDSPETRSTLADRELLGWVVVAMSTKPMHNRENQIITNSLLILLGGLVCTFIIAARFAETLTKPIINLTNVVKQLEEGFLDARVDIHSYAELGSLEKGINLLGERVQSSNQILESQVEKATQRLRKTMHHLETQNLALQRASQRADQANLAKDQFLARMSHELRTPLTSILGFTNMLRQTDLSFEQQEHCRIINQTSTMLLSLIDDILDFAKLQSDAIKLEHIPFNPEQVIFEALEMQSQSAAAKGLELAYQVDEAAYTSVVGDPTRLRQIATNLISNAIKFTDKGQILVTLRVIEQNHDQRLMQLSVKDTGIGIADDHQALLFNAFAQADPSITRRFGGSGLGLVIVQKLVQLMQGSVNLSSQENKGTQICCNFIVKTDHTLLQDSAFLPQKTDLIIFDRHPESLESLSMMTQPLVADVHACSTIQDLEKSISGIQTDAAGLIFGLSANANIASQQKLKIPGLFASFKGPILLLTPALAGNTEEFTELRNNPLLTINSKPLQRQLLKKWLNRSDVSNLQSSSENSTQPLLTGAIVLIAEDNDFNRLLLRKIIESSGATVIEAIDGEQAIKRAEEIRPDIVIMDVHMPKMDGIMATSELRKDFPTLPIIALTADVIASEEHSLRLAGVTRIEYKPINDTRLINLLETLCRKEAPIPNDRVEHPIKADNSINLVKYQLSKDELHQELTAQVEALLQAFRHNDKKSIRDHSHQLIGLAGLFELPELENYSVELNRATKTDDARKVWELLSTLKRLIAHQQYLD